VEQGADGQTAAIMQDALSDFVTRWRLNEESQTLLSNVPPDVQHKIVLEFNPRDTERDANAIFLKFARGVSQAYQGTEELQSFIHKWSLGPEASQLLMSLEPMVRTRVTKEFQPRDITSDANNIFMRFAQGVAKGGSKGFSKGKGKGFDKGNNGKGQSFTVYAPQANQMQGHVVAPLYPQGGGKGQFHQAGVQQQQQAQYPQYVQPQVQYVPASAAPQYHAPAQAPPAQAHMVEGDLMSDPVLSQFVTRWNLNPDAQSLLVSMSPHAQQKVLQEFSPRDTSRDANAIFIKFASGIAGNASRGFQQPHVQQQQQQPQHVPRTVGAHIQQQPYQPHQPQQQQVQQETQHFQQQYFQQQSQAGGGQEVEAQYIERWRLGQEAQTAFFSLLPEQQQKVMVEFAPRDTTSDANNIFIRFCQGIARGTSSGRGKGKGKDDGRFGPY